MENDPRLWRALGLREYGGYLSEEDLRQNPRRKVITQSLLLNLLTTDELTKAKERKPLRTLNSQTDESINKQIIEKFQYFHPSVLCSSGRGFYRPGWVEELNDSLVARQNKDAIERKIEWLTWGRVKFGGGWREALEHPYKKDYELAKKFKKILERL